MILYEKIWFTRRQSCTVYIYIYMYTLLDGIAIQIVAVGNHPLPLVWEMTTDCQALTIADGPNCFWLVVQARFVEEIIIPNHELIFFRGFKPPTRFVLLMFFFCCLVFE